MARERREALVELQGRGADLRRVLRERRLLPTVSDGLQQRDEARRRRENDVLPQRVVEQHRALGQRGAQELVAGDEQDHELGAALELAPIRLARELAYAAGDDRRVPLERHAPLGVRRRLGRLEIRVERRLELDETAQRDLAPLAANLGPPQRADEVACLGGERELARRERLELLADAAVRLASRLVQVLQLPLGARERLPDRRDETVDRLLARGEVAFRALGVDVQGLVREPEERLRVTLELPIRELIERGAEPLGSQLDDALALEIGGGAAAQLRVFQRHLARQRHRAPEPDQQSRREPADAGQRDVQPHARRHLCERSAQAK